MHADKGCKAIIGHARRQGIAARFYFMERFEEIAKAAASLDTSDPRAAAAARITASLAKRATHSFAEFV